MPFDGNGNYLVPTGTQAVGGTPISSTAYNAFLLDIQVALTGSMRRDAQSLPTSDLRMGGRKITGMADGALPGDAASFVQLGQEVALQVPLDGSRAMTAPLRQANGTAALPAYTFTAVPSTGMFLTGAGNLSFSREGVESFSVFANAVYSFLPMVIQGSATVQGQVLGIGGTLTAPGISFAGANDRGFGLRPDGTPRLVVGGAEVAAFSVGGWGFYIPVDFTQPVRFNNAARFSNQVLAARGTVANPGISFEEANKKGIRLREDGVPALVSDDVDVAAWAPSNFAFYVPVFPTTGVVAPNGTPASPAYRFANSPDSGWYLKPDGAIAMSLLGTERMAFEAALSYILSPLQVGGTVFCSDATTSSHAMTLGQFNAAVSTYGRTVTAAANAAAARAALGISPSGAPVIAFKMDGGGSAINFTPVITYSAVQIAPTVGTLNATTGTYTIGEAGLYAFTFMVQVPITASTNYIDCSLIKNTTAVRGARVIREFTAREWAAGVNPVATSHTIESCVAGDVIYISRNFGSGVCYVESFSGHRIN